MAERGTGPTVSQNRTRGAVESEFDRHVLEQLEAIELTPEEVRAVLDRLGQAEFRMDANSTLGDVVEATGADPSDVAMALQVVRGHDLTRVYGQRIDDHERCIGKLEEFRGPETVKEAREPEAGEALLKALRIQRAKELRAKKDQVTMAIVVLVIIAFIGFLAIMSSWQGG